MSISTNSHLCTICEKIDFASYFGEDDTGGNYPKIAHLGTCEQIKEKEACAFCDLVEAAMRSTVGYIKLDKNADIAMMRRCIGTRDNGDPNHPSRDYCIKLNALGEGNYAVNIVYIQMLLDDDPLRAYRGPFDFRMREPQGEKFDMALARGWLERCQKEHGSLCSAPGENPEQSVLPPQPAALLAIDLDHMCICSMPFGSRFIALSYCWPVKQYLVHLKLNSKEFFEKVHY